MTTFLQIGPCGPGCDENSPFPDGQPHIALSGDVVSFIKQLGHGDIEIRARVTSAIDLLNISSAVDVARNLNPDIKINLTLMYVWGRMDRRISDCEPYTLRVVCNLINSLKLHSVSAFCPHSQATTDLLNNYRQFPPDAEDAFFDHGISHSILKTTGASTDQAHWMDDLSLVFPDAGAAKRFAKSSLLTLYPNSSIVTLHKERCERTGPNQGHEDHSW